MPDTITLYSAVGATLTHYEVDADGATVQVRSSVELPAPLQYAWPHPTLPLLYCSTSNGGPRVASDINPVVVLEIGADGSPRLRDIHANLPHRAVHVCIDPTGRYMVNAHNFGGGALTVHRLRTNGDVDDQVNQEQKADFGIYPHQVRVFPSGRTVLISDRGNKAQAGKPEDPGALRTYGFEAGQLTPSQVIAPQGGFGFGPRHVDFHPTRPWIYVSDERENRLYMFRYSEGDEIEALPAHTLDTLADPAERKPRQIAGTVHVHPRGQCVYVANRADGTVDHDGRPVFNGGDNTIAVYAIDPDTGEPRILQHADTHGFHARTFACDPEGRVLVAASIKPMDVVGEGDQIVTVPAALAVFRIAEDGRLTFIRRIDVPTPPGRMQYWMGIIAGHAFQG
ncbi:lactonase family protein [Pigmentiphaga litoralis]|uniref:6-phosphogluconolactonase (Cycloisomerase 2 family) n=1 Tax=Pigmentiphaga litoralis TaxID=516702 RepID=A0A7Y9IUC3_9BURK|nr:beta-propeller fold lactonase family protein [Pigmentiphaga litoralis]NYE23154.1 6-phosphogluconolactonase (cycloisomerase 2 family) [Pigmentiphaga litoralis]NYE83231.1 6-phosphogluconolactonase (cycloisomerase 2 family) [Pigmentiphaga litoralis]